MPTTAAATATATATANISSNGSSSSSATRAGTEKYRHKVSCELSELCGTHYILFELDDHSVTTAVWYEYAGMAIECTIVYEFSS